MTPEKIIEAIKTINNEIEPTLKFSERGKILKKILENNLKATVLNDDTINLVVTEFNKYTNKRIGAKTLEKINNAIQETNPDLLIYFSGNAIRVKYNNCYLSYDNSYVEICREYDSNDKYYNHLFNGEGKFKELETGKYIVWYKANYISDPDSYINELEASHKAIIEAAETYNKAVDTFRDKAIQGLTEFDKIYPKMYLIP